MKSSEKQTLVYALHCGGLYGTERMALATASGVADRFRLVIFAPAGRALEEAARLGMETETFANSKEFARKLRRELAQSRHVAFVATSVSQSLIYIALNSLYRRPGSHIHMVHGGASQWGSYGRKRVLNRLPVDIVAVSEYVREQLLQNGVRPSKVTVITNFLPQDLLIWRPQRAPFSDGGAQTANVPIRRAIVVSRLDPQKRVDLLLLAVQRSTALKQMEIHIFGEGMDSGSLRDSAKAAGLGNIRFEGFSDDIPKEMAASDLLIHLCPTEPFGLVILEAMASGVPVLVPAAGGAGAIVTHGVSGFHFKADDVESLEQELTRIMAMTRGKLDEIVANARELPLVHFSERQGLARYRQLLGVP